MREYEIDDESRSEWKERANRGFEAVEMKATSKNYPWANAANVKYPILAEAATQFNARAYPAIVQDGDIVKCKVHGRDPQGLKSARANRVGDYMSYQLNNKIECWESDTDKLLLQLPVVGMGFRKVFYNQNRQAIRAELVTALKFVVHNNTSDLQSCPRGTQEIQYYPHEIQEYARQGLFIDHDYGMVEGTQDTDAPHDFLEQHRLLDLDGDGVREPWIITIHKATGKVARIEAGYHPEEIETRNYKGRKMITRIPRKVEYVPYSFIPDFRGGFYSLGFFHLIEGLTETINTTLNQMLDAGHLQNAGGGFIGSGLRLKKGTYRLEPGKYHTVETAGGDIRQAIYNFQHPGPSSVLFQLLGFLEGAAKGLTTIQDAMTGEMNRNAPVGTTLALIEQGMKVFNAIYKRVFSSLKKEFALIYRLNGRYTDPFDYINFFDDPSVDAHADFAANDMDLTPVADPNTVLDMQRISRAQLVLENAKDPVLGEYHNIEAALKHYYELVRIDNTESFLQTPQTPQPAPEQMMAIELDMADKQADIEKKQAETMKTVAEVEETQADTIKTMAEAENIKAEQEAEIFGNEFDQEMSNIIPFMQEGQAA
ncbi:MAG: hypothetical protein AAF228_12525 [Pseudomonadota bacterium]